ncbi:MAG: methylenetetrahydrofolate--tRNA-(uracil(54)-C(5))-methyltransferase (FADH(2)-oxidizing) TrmFO [Deltaproteobacteria bacterium]|nr:methylenetetrahydrofolate--tRNA-(uracil(54)-C(5))-methyltransferase (FADH(2)-oxidizing) TrmFO [Deltaproteobacteria bacterium]
MAKVQVDVHVIGGGLAGSEAAWQLAERGLKVTLVEMKPALLSPAHQAPFLCELVCSNSLRSDEKSTPAGLLKAELRRAGSLVIACADLHRVPAGDALAVDRVGFSREVTARIAMHPNIRILRRVVDELPQGPVIVATGPLTGGALAEEVRAALGGDRLYFYDAIAPIVDAETIDWNHAFRQSRWDSRKVDEGVGLPAGDYVNCPLSRDQYHAFVREIRAGRKISPHGFEEPKYFEGCLPIEVMADRGEDVLAFGPMRPIGLINPKTGSRPFAVVQLRPENRYFTAYNMVGFQTRLAYPEQKRVFRLVPALREAEFLRYGSIHRNSYIDSPRLLGPELELLSRPNVRFAGQITGVEGYIESCAMGLLAAVFLAARQRGTRATAPPATTALGGLYRHVRAPRQPEERFSPTNINFGLLPPADATVRKKDRRAWMTARAERDLVPWLEEVGVRPCVGVPKTERAERAALS